jgi:glutamine synthetase
MIFPAGIRYQKILADATASLSALGKPVCTTTLDELIGLLGSLQASIIRLEAVLNTAPEGTTLDHARHIHDSLLPAMASVRKDADALEAIVADDLWPLPTYQEMLFIR